MNWLAKSNRWKHLLGGIGIGVLSLGDYIASILAGIGISSALEFKDRSWGGKWDWIDWSLTILGTLIGFCISFILNIYLV